MSLKHIGKILFYVSFIISLCLFGVGDAQQESDCEQQTRNLALGRCPANNHQPCVSDLCGTQPILGQRNCSTAQHCCYVNDTCVLKELYNVIPSGRNNKDNVAQAFLEAATGDSRSLAGGLLSVEDIQNLFPSVEVNPKFPDSCLFVLQNIQPPINIPYCQRISCQPNNPFSEFDPNQCLSVPGCAYDFELFLYREFLGQAIVPGVPICHLAIRNRVFHEQANLYLRQSNTTWNPLLTECLINIYSDEILSPAPECSVVKAMQQLGYKPKHAGWRTISKRDCNLINGCWLDETCFYPYVPTEMKTQTDFIHDILALQPLLHGKPMCLPFDNVTNGEFLDAYHACYKSGCAMETDEETLLRHLFGAATDNLPRLLQHQYWTMTLLGQVRADNWREVAYRLIGESVNSNLLNSIIPNAQNQLNSGSPPHGGVSFVPFAISYNTTSGGSISRSPFLSFGTFGQFASSTGLQANTTNARQFAPGNRRRGNARNVNLRNIASSVNRELAANNTPPWRNLQSLLSGVEPPPPESTPDGSNDQRNANLLDLLPCFFQPIQWPNFPPLAGSFEDCCERPLCFIPRNELREAKSEVTSYKTFWTTWGPCSETCGGSTQTRRRFCIGDICDDDAEEVQTKTCNTQPCPTVAYSPWSEYSACSVTCGNGRQQRIRRCFLPPSSCSRRTVQMKPCRIRRCPRQQRGRIETQNTCDQSTCCIVRTQVCLLPSGQPGYCGRQFQPNRSQRTNRRCNDTTFCTVSRNRRRCRRRNG